MREQRVFIAMFERLDLTVSIEMDHEGKIINCSKNIYDVFGHKRKYALPPCACAPSGRSPVSQLTHLAGTCAGRTWAS